MGDDIENDNSNVILNKEGLYELFSLVPNIKQEFELYIKTKIKKALKSKVLNEYKQKLLNEIKMEKLGKIDEKVKQLEQFKDQIDKNKKKKYKLVEMLELKKDSKIINIILLPKSIAIQKDENIILFYHSWTYQLINKLDISSYININKNFDILSNKIIDKILLLKQGDIIIKNKNINYAILITPITYKSTKVIFPYSESLEIIFETINQ